MGADGSTISQFLVCGPRFYVQMPSVKLLYGSIMNPFKKDLLALERFQSFGGAL